MYRNYNINDKTGPIYRKRLNCTKDDTFNSVINKNRFFNKKSKYH